MQAPSQSQHAGAQTSEPNLALMVERIQKADTRSEVAKIIFGFGSYILYGLPEQNRRDVLQKAMDRSNELPDEKTEEPWEMRFNVCKAAYNKDENYQEYRDQLFERHPRWDTAQMLQAFNDAETLALEHRHKRSKQSQSQAQAQSQAQETGAQAAEPVVPEQVAAKLAHIAAATRTSSVANIIFEGRLGAEYTLYAMPTSQRYTILRAAINRFTALIPESKRGCGPTEMRLMICKRASEKNLPGNLPDYVRYRNFFMNKHKDWIDQQMEQAIKDGEALADNV